MLSVDKRDRDPKGRWWFAVGRTNLEILEAKLAISRAREGELTVVKGVAALLFV